MGATQEEVLRSISRNFEQSGDPMAFLASLLAIVGGILLLVWLGHYRSRLATPRKTNHPGRLMRELTKKAGLKPADVKRLRPLAEEMGVSSPLVLMLCPSMVNRAMHRRGEGK